ncbi:hypothetical protein F5890DRAFT_1560117 [Lentinula detonsa]|uniref:Uncharacterized protein n=1 Tax=Lentinula detonsa TaxID=2804962 RepID=A0AA38PNT4_9AGAR|nr:hypothetical protein F5890DRAFT_1560117 [Lentinula detonsa]
MPANKTLIVAFIGFHMGNVSGSCIKSWLSGLSAWHDMAGAPWPSSSRLIHFAQVSAKTAGAVHERARRNPITLAHMLALHVNLKFSLPFHCSIWAVACIAFWGCQHLGELIIPSKQGFDPKCHVSRSTTLKTSYNADNSRKALSFEIPWTKTTKELGATVIATAQHNSLTPFCPFIAIERHMDANMNIPEGYSLLAYLDDQGFPRNMVKSSFLGTCGKIWENANLGNVQGHSFHIGGAVELLLAGVKPEVVAALGGWTSLAFFTILATLRGYYPYLLTFLKLMISLRY